MNTRAQARVPAVGVQVPLLGHANPREAFVLDDASLAFLPLCKLPRDLCVLCSAASPDGDKRLRRIGLKGDARRSAFDHDVLTAKRSTGFTGFVRPVISLMK